ncbi:MAG: phosphoenolpyruvate synthase [Deltaproteobacteria bacterium]|nr:phosphoenolpyruvate synthase [Deltaproteobacteria bacterium]
MSSLVIPFREASLDLLHVVGGKNASLGEMTRALSEAGVRVPGGFATTAEGFRLHLREAGIEDAIHRALDRLDVKDVAALEAAGREARGLIRSAPLPNAVSTAVLEAYATLSRDHGEDETDVAVRSSATAEDLPSASFAGQQETFLNVRGREALLAAVRDCMASLFTDRAIVYRAERGFAHRDVALSVGVQKMVRSDLASAGVIFTLDTETGFRDVVLITGAWGLGESLVQGRVDPDELWVHKPTARAGFRSILRREVGEKATKLVYADGARAAVSEVRVSADDRRRLVLSDDEVMELTRWAIAVEDHYSRRHGRPTPMDLEWAKDGRTGELFIVQARPETVHSQKGEPTMEIYKLRGSGEVLLRGKSVGGKIAAGPVRIVRSSADLAAFRPGEVLVAPMTDPDWEPVLRKAAAVVTDHGGRTCHAAIVAREIGIACVVGAGDATGVLEGGREVTVSASDGGEGRVYAGRIAFDREELRPSELPASPVPLMLNLANPDLAFSLSALPNAGVGLLRVEFLVSKRIGVHPMALVHSERVADAGERAEILRRAAGSSSPAEFFVEQMASGVAIITAAFHPNPVIVRLSDFKTNEYAGLLGGRAFEPVEANPMIGFRGASRYYDDRYREGFALECEALRRVREDMGLRNLKVMVPFCRTLEEGRKVIAEMARHGLVRGKNGLEVYVMCEIPNNVVLAKEFSEIFDGFSIGSNDLTQLTLGVDRDSELLAHVFDEQDPGVKRMISMVVAEAHRAGRKVGICGQAPSDYPEFAEFLMSIGIDSISLTPDALPGVARRLAAATVASKGAARAS